LTVEVNGSIDRKNRDAAIVGDDVSAAVAFLTVTHRGMQGAARLEHPDAELGIMALGDELQSCRHLKGVTGALASYDQQPVF
jgi:hypothetical protein